MKKEDNSSKSKLGTIFKVAIMILLCLLVLAILYSRYLNPHFANSTTINGIDFSNSTVEDVKKALESEDVTLDFTGDNVFTAKKSELGLSINEEVIEELLKQQRYLELRENRDNLDFTIDSKEFDLDETVLMQYAKSLPCLTEMSLVEPQDAYVEIGDDNLLYVVPEKLGYIIDFDKAYAYLKDQLQAGETSISFKSLISTEPSVYAKDLEENVQRINTMLDTEITYILNDQSRVVLDKNTIEKWIYQDENGNYQIDVEQNVDAFLSGLQKSVKELGKTMIFIKEDGTEIILPVQNGKENSIDIEKEKSEIMQALEHGEKFEREVFYSKFNDAYWSSNYVTIDIENQTVKLYKSTNGYSECILETPCVTGNVSAGNGTPTGYYEVAYKTINAHLSMYDVDVSYWMPFNGDIGMHDADGWRSAYGGNIYKTDGSHGCVNLPKKAAKTIYENVEPGTPVIVF